MPLPTLFFLSQKGPHQESLLLQETDGTNQMDGKLEKEKRAQEETKKEERQAKERTSPHIQDQVATIRIHQTGGPMETEM